MLPVTSGPGRTRSALGKEGPMPGTTRRNVLIRAGALAATAVAAPILAACQPAAKTGGSGKVVVMTDPNEFNDDDRKTLEAATKLKIEVVASNLTTLYAMFAAASRVLRSSSLNSFGSVI